MTDVIEQLRRLVDAREKATPGPYEARFLHRVWESARKDPLNLFGAEPAQDWHDCVFFAAAGNTNLKAILTRMEKMEAALRYYADHKRNTKDGIYGRDNMVRGYFEHDQGQRAKAFE